ncbi:MAG: ABC transporter ATP-binding protein, partial [Thermoanaerobaculia bacterium]|nr:ABC transporter ATP-binding protein [Thermoanaerobaculia bacterium]
DDVYERPRHPYTRALLEAIPLPDPSRRRELRVLEGDVPSPIDPPPGCPFHPRCPHAEDRCLSELPLLREVGAGPGDHQVACHFDL